MRRGCISLGDIKCNQCQRVIAFSERYLVNDGEEEAGTEKEGTTHLCVECALEKGYAYYKEDKNERILTFFP